MAAGGGKSPREEQGREGRGCERRSARQGSGPELEMVGGAVRRGAGRGCPGQVSGRGCTKREGRDEDVMGVAERERGRGCKGSGGRIPVG